MSVPDLTRRCTRCGTRFLITGHQRAILGADALPEHCSGCLALERLTQKRRGTVHWYDRRKGFGFIHDEQGQRVFVHRTAIVGRRHLRRGQSVAYRLEQGERGPQASQVELGE